MDPANELPENPLDEEHYQKMPVEPYTLMKDLGILEGYLMGAALKYFLRAGYKGSRIYDLAKASRSINDLIQHLEGDVPF